MSHVCSCRRGVQAGRRDDHGPQASAHIELRLDGSNVWRAVCGELHQRGNPSALFTGLLAQTWIRSGSDNLLYF